MEFTDEQKRIYTFTHALESPEYYRFLRVYSVALNILQVVLAYALTLFFRFHPEFIDFWRGVLFHPMVMRMDELRAFGGTSQFAYLGTVISGFITFIPFLAIMLFGYWWTVIKTGQVGKIDGRALILPLVGLVFFGACFWLFFLFNVKISGVQYLGQRAIFLWPIFPLIGACSILLIIGVCCQFILGIYKYLSQWLGVK